MSPRAPSCRACGAVAASDQDYCIECGERILRGPSPWLGALAVIGVVLAISAAAVVLAYRGLTDDADREAAAPSPVSTQAAKAGQPVKSKRSTSKSAKSR